MTIILIINYSNFFPIKKKEILQRNRSTSTVKEPMEVSKVTSGGPSSLASIFIVAFKTTTLSETQKRNNADECARQRAFIGILSWVGPNWVRLGCSSFLLNALLLLHKHPSSRRHLFESFDNKITIIIIEY